MTSLINDSPYCIKCNSDKYHVIRDSIEALAREYFNISSNEKVSVEGWLLSHIARKEKEIENLKKNVTNG